MFVFAPFCFGGREISLFFFNRVFWGNMHKVFIVCVFQSCFEGFLVFVFSLLSCLESEL